MSSHSRSVEMLPGCDAVLALLSDGKELTFFQIRDALEFEHKACSAVVGFLSRRSMITRVASRPVRWIIARQGTAIALSNAVKTADNLPRVVRFT